MWENNNFGYSKGQIKLFALPGAEYYRDRVINHIAELIYDNHKNCLSQVFSKRGLDDCLQCNTYKDSFNSSIITLDSIKNELMGEIQYFSHDDKSIETYIPSSIRKSDCYVFHTDHTANAMDENGKTFYLDSNTQQKLLWDSMSAFTQGKKESLNLFELYLSAARSDKPKLGRGSTNLKTYFENLENSCIDNWMIYQLHSSDSLIGLDQKKCTADNIPGSSLLLQYLLEYEIHENEKELLLHHDGLRNWNFSPVDGSGQSYVKKFADLFGANLNHVHKRRDQKTNKVLETRLLLEEEDQLKDAIVWITDDMISTGGSLGYVIKKIKEFGPKEINFLATYGIFNGNAKENISQWHNDGLLDKIIVSDLIMQDDSFYNTFPFVHVIDSSKTTANIIYRTNRNESISQFLKGIDVQNYLKTGKFF